VVAATAPLTYNSGTQTVAISAATTSAAGSMSAADKAKLDGIASGAQVNVATDITYDAATREVRSSTGGDATIPLVSTSSAGLAPATGTPSGKYLKDDGTWATVEAGASPAGTGSELQFRSSSTAFGAVTGSSVDGSGNITIGTRWISSLNGAASAPPVALTGTWFTGGTATTTKPHVLIEPSGTTSTGWITTGTGLGVNAPSGFTGRFLDLQRNGSSVCSVTWDGAFFYGGITRTSNQFSFERSGVNLFTANASVFHTTVPIGIGSSGNLLHRDGSDGFIAQRNGTSAQNFRVYDTYASDTDYHRIAIATARATLSNVSGASVTATGLIPAGSVVMGVTSKVTTVLGTANGTTGYQVGTAADPDRWGAITGTAAGTTSDNRNWTAGTIECFPAATNVIVTATGGNFNGTGVIYLSVQYMAGEAD
jgi:hypothetical protein